jgi:hypothetical protein
MTGKVIQGSFLTGQPRWSPSVQPKIAPSSFPAKTVAPPPTAFAARPPGAPPPAFVARRPGPAPTVVAVRPTQPPAPAQAVQPTAVQRHGAGGAFAVEARQVGLVSNGGSPLPDAVRGKMEAALGADFSNVRVHVGPQADRIGAIAFTVGSDIYFAPGRYQPGTIQGQQLLGHELAHVVQQRAGRVRNPLGAALAVVQDRALEAEADRLGQRAATHGVAMQAKPSIPGSVSPTPRDPGTWLRGHPILRSRVATRPSRGGVLQRDVLWGPKNRIDNQLDKFADALQALVDEAAEACLTPMGLDPGLPFFKRWQETALAYLEDENDKAFLHARYGYAVETYVNEQLSTLTVTLPHGCTPHKQVTFGGSRPDVIVRASGADIAWFDITSADSAGHIYLKYHSGWSVRPYVAEITYPALDLDRISAGGKLTKEQVRIAKKARAVRLVEYRNALEKVAKWARLAVMATNNQKKRREQFELGLQALFHLDEKPRPRLAKAFVDLLFEQGTMSNDYWSFKNAFGYTAYKNPARSLALEALEGRV